jgi:hypothetical protein
MDKFKEEKGTREKLTKYEMRKMDKYENVEE